LGAENDAGRALRPGMYRLRFAAAGIVQTRKIAVTR
jgi:hypothetical protein